VAQRVLPRSVQAAIGSVRRVLNTDVNVAFRNLSNRALGRGVRGAPRTGTATTLSCFTAGTMVATNEGFRPIETMRPGDRVWSFDVVKQQWRLCRVAKPYSIAYDGTLVLVTIAGETTEATYQHPYWVVRGEELAFRPRAQHLAEVPADATMPGRWVDSCDLRVRDEVLLRDGRVVPVERLEHRFFKGAVYNMEVDDLHCYTVGRNSILVHNSNGPLRGRAPEYPGGQVTESGFLRSAEEYLGLGYRSLPNGRYVSANGLRQVRFGAHEIRGPVLHGHFEAYNFSGGRVIENTSVIIIPD
jgi:hypothetical protein